MTALELPRPFTVSYSENRVLRELLSDGATNPEMAQRLHLTEDTVKSHMKSMLRKAGLPHRTALVVAIMRGRLIPTPWAFPEQDAEESVA